MEGGGRVWANGCSGRARGPSPRPRAHFVWPGATRHCFDLLRLSRRGAMMGCGERLGSVVGVWAVLDRSCELELLPVPRSRVWVLCSDLCGGARRATLPGRFAHKDAAETTADSDSDDRPCTLHPARPAPLRTTTVATTCRDVWCILCCRRPTHLLCQRRWCRFSRLTSGLLRIHLVAWLPVCALLSRN